MRAAGPDGHAVPSRTTRSIVATGVETSYFGHDEWEAVAPGLKTLEDARWVRTHILGAFEMAELAAETRPRRAWLTFVIVGAGPTGVELTGEIATLARRILPRDFRRVATATHASCSSTPVPTCCRRSPRSCAVASRPI